MGLNGVIFLNWPIQGLRMKIWYERGEQSRSAGTMNREELTSCMPLGLIPLHGLSDRLLGGTHHRVTVIGAQDFKVQV